MEGADTVSRNSSMCVGAGSSSNSVTAGIAAAVGAFSDAKTRIIPDMDENELMYRQKLGRISRRSVAFHRLM